MIRLRQICLVAGALAPASEAIEAVLGLAPCYHDPNVGQWGLENVLFPVGDRFLEIVAPVREGTAAGRFLARRGGDGGYMAIHQCDDLDRRRAHVAALGIRLATELDYGDFRGIQLHPRDTGGAIVELDRQDGIERPDGPWHPAGDDWQRARHTDRIAALAGAELQSPDPAALAQRWSEVLQLPLARGEDGAPTLTYDDGARLRFVAAADGRGEGLGGVDLHAADRAAVLAEAERRGCRLGDDAVMICGTRFRLV